MEVTTVITFDLRNFREVSAKDSIIVLRNTLVRFEFQNSLAGASFPEESEFVVFFERSPFRDHKLGFRRMISRRHNYPISLGQAVADREGEYKFSIGIQKAKRWEIEIDPWLIVLPSTSSKLYRR